jgi:glycosyltransferase involved in cell wall biosynthesis
MSSSLPCVVTDVGDSAHMVGGTGAVVPPNDPEAMAAAWLKILGMTAEARAAMGRNARERVRANWSLPVMAARYRSVYECGITVPDSLGDCESVL